MEKAQTANQQHTAGAHSVVSQPHQPLEPQPTEPRERAKPDLEPKRRDSVLESDSEGEAQQSSSPPTLSSSNHENEAGGLWLRADAHVGEEQHPSNNEDDNWPRWHSSPAAVAAAASHHPIWMTHFTPPSAMTKPATRQLLLPPDVPVPTIALPFRTGRQIPAAAGEEDADADTDADADVDSDFELDRRHDAFVRHSITAHLRATRSKLLPAPPQDVGGPEGGPEAAHDWHREDFSAWWRNDGSDSDSDPGTVIRLPPVGGRGRAATRGR